MNLVLYEHYKLACAMHKRYLILKAASHLDAFSGYRLGI